MSLRVEEAERVSLPLSLMQTQEAPILSLIALIFFFFFPQCTTISPTPNGLMPNLTAQT